MSDHKNGHHKDDHKTDGHHGHAVQDTTTSTIALGCFRGCMVIVAVVVVVFALLAFKACMTPRVVYKVEETSNPIRGTTPTELVVNFKFNLEADGPLKVIYEDGQSYVYTPGECFTAPTPRSLGPKKFRDPNNEAEGRVKFRIYRLRSSEGGECN